jgi:hypothetical protein
MVESNMIKQDTNPRKDVPRGRDAETPEPVDRNHTLPEDIAASVTDGTPGSKEAPGLNETFELLKNYRRRCILVYLSTEESSASLSDLAEEIAGWENDKDPRLLTSSERKRVYVSLYQSHLPKMDDMGAISYNKPRGTLERGEYFGNFLEYLPSDGEPRESVVRRCCRGLVASISTVR